MKPITSAQLKIIHVLLKDLGIENRKAGLVLSFTEGRTENSREMTLKEAKSLIECLKGREEHTGYINRIWHTAYEMGIIVEGDSTEKAINAAALNTFCLKRGSVKKPLGSQSLTELKKTVRQFEAMYTKHLIKKELQEDLGYAKRLHDLFVENEVYEEAVKTQKWIDHINAKIQPKRKRALKTV
jgi:hypothetical protein